MFITNINNCTVKRRLDEHSFTSEYEWRRKKKSSTHVSPVTPPYDKPTQNNFKVILQSGGVHLAGDVQAVEALHVFYGIGQNLCRLHGGHLPAGLR